jgi:hypothetical protein
MTRKQEILTDYRLIVMEIETLERQSKFLNKYIGGPRPLRGVQLTGMPRGTNDPEAAMLQQVEEDDPVYHIEELSKELGLMLLEFEQIVNEIKDRRLFIIVRNYYGLGWTDEKIAEYFTDNNGEDDDGRRMMARQTVQKLRSDYFNSLA